MSKVTPEKTFATICALFDKGLPRGVESLFGDVALGMGAVSSALRADPVFSFTSAPPIKVALGTPFGDMPFPFDSFLVVCQGAVTLFAIRQNGTKSMLSVAVREDNDGNVYPGQFIAFGGDFLDGEWRRTSIVVLSVTTAREFDMGGDENRELSEALNPMIEGVASCALLSVESIMQPINHILVESPRIVRPQNAPKIPRLHERPRHILVNPNEVHKIYTRTEDEERSLRTLTPHARRGYSKVLRSERFTEEKRGKTIYIRPTWVGPGEWETAGRKYKVVL